MSIEDEQAASALERIEDGVWGPKSTAAREASRERIEALAAEADAGDPLANMTMRDAFRMLAQHGERR